MRYPSITESISAYLDSIALSRSQNTTRTYSNALASFSAMLEDLDINPEITPCRDADENWVTDFASALNIYAPATERLYLTALSGWFEFLAAEEIADINLPRVRLLIRRRARRAGQRLPQFPRKNIEDVLEFAMNLIQYPSEDTRKRLILLRDRALLITLADTGLRVHEACNLRRGDLDWNEGRAVIIGKGDRQAVVRFSRRSLDALRDYLSLRLSSHVTIQVLEKRSSQSQQQPQELLCTHAYVRRWAMMLNQSSLPIHSGTTLSPLCCGDLAAILNWRKN
jgi:integrase/recombinase XerC